jgi:hypothetical protein
MGRELRAPSFFICGRARVPVPDRDGQECPSHTVFDFQLPIFNNFQLPILLARRRS